MDKELYVQCLYKKVNDDVLKGLINNIGDKVKWKEKINKIKKEFSEEDVF